MKVTEEFEIPLSGLKEGIHNYGFEISTGFFEHFNNPDLPGGKLDLNVILHKRPQFLELDFQFTGSLSLVCDRCLDSFDYEVDFTEKLFVRYGDDYEELDDNIIVIPRDESRLNIAQFIYEFAALSIPFKKVHPENQNGTTGCDPEMIKKLNELKAEEKHFTKENTDPRWDKLKNLN